MSTSKIESLSSVTRQTQNARDASRATFARDMQGIMSLSITQEPKHDIPYNGRDNHLHTSPIIIGGF
jgi:hypothetical protein